MSKPRLYANLKVEINPNATKAFERTKYIQVFRNSVKQGDEYSFSIDKLTTDPQEKKEAFKLINQELGQFFPRGANEDKNGKFAFYAEPAQTPLGQWRANQLGTKIEEILTKKFQVTTPQQTTTPQIDLRKQLGGYILYYRRVVKVDGMSLDNNVLSEFVKKVGSNKLEKQVFSATDSDFDYFAELLTLKDGDLFKLFYNGNQLPKQVVVKIDSTTKDIKFIEKNTNSLEVFIGVGEERAKSVLWEMGGEYLGSVNSSSSTSQQSGTPSKYTLPNSGVKVEFDADVIKFEVKANNCDTVKLRLGVVNYLESSEYIERNTANSNELYYSSSFSAKLNDNGLINTKEFLEKLDRLLSTRDIAVGKLWCFSVGDYFYTSANGTIVKIIQINSAEDKPYRIEFFTSIPQQGIISNEIFATKDDLLELVRKGSFISLKIIEDDEFYLETVDKNLNKNNFEIKINKIDGIDIEFTRKMNYVSNKSRSTFNEFKELLWKNGYRFKNIKSKLSETPESDEILNLREMDKAPSSTEEEEIEQLNKDIAQLMFFKSILSPIDFEKKIELSQEIEKKQKRVNELNFYLLEKRIQSNNIFEELFEQSFNPINNAYEGVYSTSPDDTDFFTPDGKKSELSDSLNVMIRTPQFKAWFGDWELAYLYRDTDAVEIECSKVLTKNYEPLVVWHGTGDEFSYFKFDTFPAAYFAVNREYSEFFAQLHGDDNGFVIPFFLNIRNPLDLTHFETKDVSVKDFFDYIFLQTGLDMSDLEVNPIFFDDSFQPVQTWIFIRNNPTMLQKIASLNVFDGIRFYETNPNVRDTSSRAHKTEAFITFNANQSKIADPERGTILLGAMKSFILEKGGAL